MIWKSKNLYEHPAPHQAGTCGQIVQHDSGVYKLIAGGSQMSCPQDWAAGIHKSETDNQTVSLRIPGDLLEQIDRAAEEDNRSRSNLIVKILREKFADIT